MKKNTKKTNENAGAAEVRPSTKVVDDARPAAEVVASILRGEARQYAKVADPETKRILEAVADALKTPANLSKLIGSAA